MHTACLLSQPVSKKTLAVSGQIYPFMCQQVILVQYTIHSMFICLYCLLNQHPWNVCPLSFIPMKSDLLNQTIQSRRARKQNAITIPKNVHSTLITSFSELGTADSSLNNPSSLKIHQNAVFYILTRTWIHWLNVPSKKSRNLFICTQTRNISSSRPSGFFPFTAHC